MSRHGHGMEHELLKPIMNKADHILALINVNQDNNTTLEEKKKRQFYYILSVYRKQDWPKYPTTAMTSVANKIAVIGSGISGAVCASLLAKNGVSVTIFESGRGPGGRMSQRREIGEDGRELLFDHGAPYFTASNPEVLGLVHDWETKGFVAPWNEKLGSFDYDSKKFLDIEQEGSSHKYVGVPGMNSVCRALLCESGVHSMFGAGVGKLEWLDQEAWSLSSLNGQDLGQFKGVVASDKSTFSSRFRNATGRPPPIDLNMVPHIALKIKEIPVISCFALMLAFERPLSLIPVKGFSFKNSDILSWAFCDSSKPGRSTASERWVLHSTVKYAEGIIAQTGLQKPSVETLAKVADELFGEFQRTGICISQPVFKKAHRWGSAFPAASVAPEEKCLWDAMTRLAICGDFCVSPNVEGAISSGIAAASKISEMLSSL